MFARTALLQKHARPGLNPYIETLSGKRVGLMLIIQIRSDDNFRVADNPPRTPSFHFPQPRFWTGIGVRPTRRLHRQPDLGTFSAGTLLIPLPTQLRDLGRRAGFHAYPLRQNPAAVPLAQACLGCTGLAEILLRRKPTENARRPRHDRRTECARSRWSAALLHFWPETRTSKRGHTVTLGDSNRRRLFLCAVNLGHSRYDCEARRRIANVQSSYDE